MRTTLTNIEVINLAKVEVENLNKSYIISSKEDIYRVLRSNNRTLYKFGIINRSQRIWLNQQLLKDLGDEELLTSFKKIWVEVS